MNISEEAYKEIFLKSPVAKLIINTDSPHYTILDVNDAYLFATSSERNLLIGKSVFAVFPKNPTDKEAKNIKQAIYSFNQAIETKKPHILDKYRYDIPVSGTDHFSERYWTTVNTPIVDEKGEVKYLIHSPSDITEVHHLENREKANLQSLKNQRKQLYSIFMQAPVGIGIFKGREYIVDLMNPPLCELLGKPLSAMIGKPIFEVLSQAKDQGFEELLDHVMETGETYEGKGVEIPLIRNGLLEKVYVDYVYEPFYDENNDITGVIVIASEVTDQVSAIHKLEEAEERARLAADAVNLGVFDLNILNGEMITSKRFANIFGFKAPVPRDHYVNAMHPEDLALRSKAHETAIEIGNLKYEARVIWPDQSLHWVRVEGRTMYDAGNNPVRILGTLLDITDQKWDKEQQSKLVTLVNNSVDLMSIVNMQGINTYINTAGINLLGFDSLEQALQVPVSGLHHVEDFELIKQEILPTVMREGKWAGKIMVRNFSTGEVFPVYNNCIRIDDSITGVPIAMGAVMRDLRPELSAKQALADSEHLLRKITSAAPTALWMSDKNGVITYVNQTWVDWSGNTLEENMGSGWYSVILPEDRAQVEDRFQTSVKFRLPYEVEFRINHADGTQHWCVATGQPQYTPKGKFSGYIGSCTDITEHKELQNQKDNFIGIASHELKTPVTSLKGYTQVLERILKKKGHEVEAAMMKKMDTQLNRLTNLIGDLLDVTKINSGKLQFNTQEFDLQPLMRELVEDLQRTTQKHLLVENYQPTDLVFADKERIEQVIINLLTNAIKYSPQSDKIIIHCKQVNKEIIVGIEDYGVGISKQNLLKVFEQFYRVSGEMQHTFPGLGLGLYISAEIIKRVGGRIWVESEENIGSCFYFALPSSK